MTLLTAFFVWVGNEARDTSGKQFDGGVTIHQGLIYIFGSGGYGRAIGLAQSTDYAKSQDGGGKTTYKNDKQWLY